LDIRISQDKSRVRVFVVHTNEELIIAQETARLVAYAGR
jgi:acetate kinase